MLQTKRTYIKPATSASVKAIKTPIYPVFNHNKQIDTIIKFMITTNAAKIEYSLYLENARKTNRDVVARISIQI